MIYMILFLISVTLVNTQFISSPQNAFCSCSDIQTQSLCTSMATLQGICGWRNGGCYELTCSERISSQSQCESDYGDYWCGWYLNSTCVNPNLCEQISSPSRCQASGCLYVQSNNNSTSGQCTGPYLNAIQCESVIASQCENYYFYDYTNNYYKYCYLNSNGQCQTMPGCNQAKTVSQCNQPYCTWIITDQSCVVTTCEVLTSQSQCESINQNSMISWYQNCQWTGTSCVNTQCKNLTQTQCNENGLCSWTDNTCKNLECSSLTNANTCFSYSNPYGGQTLCTWVTNSDGIGGQCSTCNAYGPSVVITPSGYPAFNRILQLAISFFLLCYII